MQYLIVGITFVLISWRILILNEYPGCIIDITKSIPKSSHLIFCVPLLFMNHSKIFLRIIFHLVHVGPLFQLQNGYPNMLSNLGSEKLNPRYLHTFVFHESSENIPINNLSLCACGTTFESPKWVSKYSLRYPFWRFKSGPICTKCQIIFGNFFIQFMKNERTYIMRVKLFRSKIQEHIWIPILEFQK